jgi:hypothetical protein
LTVRQWSRGAAIAWLLLVTSTTSFAASMDDLLRAYPDALAGFDCGFRSIVITNSG